MFCLLLYRRLVRYVLLCAQREASARSAPPCLGSATTCARGLPQLMEPHALTMSQAGGAMFVDVTAPRGAKVTVAIILSTIRACRVEGGAAVRAR